MKRTDTWKTKKDNKMVPQKATDDGFDDPLDAMSLNALEEQQRKIEEAIASKRRSLQQETADKINRLLEQTGFTLEQLFPQRIKPKRSGRITHMHPNDKSKTWSGNGRRPEWLNDLIQQGRDPDEFRIRA